MNDYLQVVTTVQSKDVARRIADRLVEKRLAACVQIAGPIMSVYRWRGKVESAEEWQLRAKTRGSLYEAVEREILAGHPYEVPEIVALPIAAGSADYLAWIGEETSGE
ncbi:MAG: divalent-cation tolerance protein CutA [Thermoguttaceae bacterium]